MKIVRIRVRNIGFSGSPVTLRRHLVSNASLFDDFDTKPGGWFGPVVCTLVEVEASVGTVGIGTAGAFQGGALELILSYYADLVLGEDPRRHRAVFTRMKERFGFGPNDGPRGMRGTSSSPHRPRGRRRRR